MISEGDLLVERYALEAKIARGGMATVWKARDEVLARAIALKVLHDHLADDPAFLERFKREAIAAARLAHPHIASIYDTGTTSGDNGCHFIVMEYCERGTLAEALAREGSMEPARVVGIGRTICEALSYAHTAGVIHRDVKPANVLVTEDGSLKLTDFGIAKAAFATGDVTTTGEILGTVRYLSPEQLQGDEPDERSDIYSLGVMLYELVTGRPPFAEDSQLATALKHLRTDPPSPRSVKAGIPRDLDSAIMRALHKDRDSRWSAASDLRSALADMGSASSTTSLPRMPRGPMPDGSPDRRSATADTRWLLPVIGLVIAAIVLAIALQALFDDGPRGSGDGASGQGALGPVRPQSVRDFDPHGGGEEHSESADLVLDGNEATAWTTETYSSSFELLGKPGVGLLFDLGSGSEIARVEVDGTGGYGLEILAGDEQPALETDLTEVAARDGAPGTTRFPFEPTAARYWLVWIVELSGGRAGLTEVRFFGP